MKVQNPNHILFIDDDIDDFYLLKSVLDKYEFPIEIEWFSNGESAIKHLINHATNDTQPTNYMVLLDLNMPEFDGMQTLQAIKKHPILCHTPVIIYTTSQANHDINQAYEWGANSYLIKPSSLADMNTLLTSLCNYWFHTVELTPL